MTLLTDETVRVSAPRARIWSVFDDAAALRRVLPGCEALDATGPGTFRGVLATKLPFLTLRADVTATLAGVERPDRLRLELDGRPRGLAGSFRAVIPIDLAEDGADTLVHYRVDLTTSGRLAAFGAPLMRDTMKRQVAALIANLETELGSGARGEDTGA
ncbi:MAG: CoxG family protein [Chloroflexota bacterium]